MKRFTTSDGLTLAFRDEGAGLPVLCLPGLTRNGLDFDPLASALSGVRLIRLDPRGRGASDRDPDYRNYNVGVEARDALELLDHLGLERAVIVGTSRGGVLALVIAATARDRLLGVVLNDIGPDIDPAGVARILGYLGQPSPFATLDAAAAAAADAYRGDFPDLDAAAWLAQLARIWEETPDGLVHRYDTRLRDAFREQSEQGAGFDLWPLFDCLAGIPLAVLRGEFSDILSPATVDAMRARRPDMVVATVPNRGHVPLLDEPESLAAIRELLARAGT